MHDLVRERLVISLACAAHMEAAFEWTREYVQQREGLKDKINDDFDMKTDIKIIGCTESVVKWNSLLNLVNNSNEFKLLEHRW